MKWRRRAGQGELDAALLLNDAHIETRIGLEHLTRVVGAAADVENRQCTLAQHLMHVTLAYALQAIDFVL